MLRHQIKSAFWRGFWEGVNPLFLLTMAVFWLGHVAYLLGDRLHVPGMYRIYNRLMLWSADLQDRFGFTSPWSKPESQREAHEPEANQ